MDNVGADSISAHWDYRMCGSMELTPTDYCCIEVVCCVLPLVSTQILGTAPPGVKKILASLLTLSASLNFPCVLICSSSRSFCARRREENRVAISR